MKRIRVPSIAAPIRAEWRHNAALRRATVSDIAVNMAVAVCLIGGGWDRVAGPAFGTLRDSGGPYWWGSLFAAVAVGVTVTVWTTSGALAWCLRWSTVPMIVFGLMIGHAALVDPHASFVGMALSLTLAYQAVSRADLYSDVHLRTQAPPMVAAHV